MSNIGRTAVLTLALVTVVVTPVLAQQRGGLFERGLSKSQIEGLHWMLAIPADILLGLADKKTGGRTAHSNR